MKKYTATQLRNLLSSRARVVNESSFFRPIQPSAPVISYRPPNRHQMGRWVVTRSGYKTDPEHGHFLDGHNKIFRVDGVTPKEPARVLAIDWASEEYGYTTAEWAKTPFGSWAPKTALDAALWHHLPELFEKPITTIYIPPTELPDVRPLAEVVQHVPSVEADGWYRVVGANVAVFIQATSEHDAKTRVELMIQRMSMDCTLELHITKRDPEVG